jgi:hypothetical protein
VRVYVCACVCVSCVCFCVSMRSWLAACRSCVFVVHARVCSSICAMRAAAASCDERREAGGHGAHVHRARLGLGLGLRSESLAAFVAMA